MKKKGQETTPSAWLEEQARRINEEQPIIDTKYYVVEIIPSKRYSDEYENGWTKQDAIVVGGYFGLLKESEETIARLLDYIKEN